jgi:hypothetical protein
MMNVESKLIGLVLIALLAGLGGGYGLGYVIYQPQVQNLQNGIGDLSDRFNLLNSTLRDTESSVVSLQNGLSSTNSKVTSLNSTVEEIENRIWHEASSLEGSSDAVGGSFQIKGRWMRIRWYMNGFNSSAWIQINIRHSNGTLYAERGSSGVYGSYACDIVYETPLGEYYLQIATYNVYHYLVVVWDYYQNRCFH